MKSRKAIQGFLLGVVLIAGVFVAAKPASGHSGDLIDSVFAAVPPTIDGAMAPGEWADAAVVNLTAISGNRLPAYLLVKNNETFLWLAYDATGDATASANDSASFALDTGHDGVATDGGEDQFVLSGIFPGGSAHLVRGNGTYVVEDAPFDPGLPRHAGLAGARGFGPSDRSATDHRLYEFQVPLVLIRAGPGDTLGLFGGSYPVPGVADYGTFAYSTWPAYVGGPIPIGSYGDLNLAVLPGPIGIALSPSTVSEQGASGETVWYNLTARNTGASVSDTFDVTLASSWSADLRTADGTAPLPDTDSDGVPDTGNLTSGSSATFVVRVTIPPNATGCDLAMVTATSSWNLSVSDTSALTTCLSPASFAPPHSDFGVDSNLNGRFDFLQVNVSLIVSVTGTYFVRGDLFDSNGSVPLGNAGANFSSPSGPRIAFLDFDGRTIFRSGLDGPYMVRLALYDSGFQAIDSDTYVTRPYNATDFEPPPAVFRPPHYDRGIDTDQPPDGRYDVLSLNVSLFVSRAGTYEVDSLVTDSSGGFVTYGSSTFSVPTGNQMVNFLYPGDRFATASADGPYTIFLSLYESFVLIDTDVHVTGPYRRTDFDPPPIAFAPPHSDRGLDTDVPPDGLYNWLVLSANVTIAEAGDYAIGATLYDPGGFVFISTASTTRTLGVGPATVDLRFPGQDIRRAGFSGNYLVSLFAYPLSVNGTGDNDFYVTGSYLYTQFQPPPALLSPPHTDRGVDTSNPADGAYDWLEISVGITVSRAGRFTLEGTLVGTGVIAVAASTANLSIGSTRLPLQFDGHLIRLTQRDASFEVDLRLYDADGILIDMGVTYTNFYRASDFQPLDGSTPDSSASVAGGYWKNGPVRVTFAADDPSPSDGLASVQLFYRYSANNATWSAWTPFETRPAPGPGLRTMSGDFLFDLPSGEGYYQLYSSATDRSGQSEPAPATADVRLAAFVPAKIDLTPATASIEAGNPTVFEAHVMNAAGAAVVLESPVVVTLVSDSRGGEFRAPATSTVITTLTIPAGASKAPFEYRDTVAGTTTITAVSPKTAPDSSTLTVSPGPVSAIAISPGAGALTVGSTVTLTATAQDAYGNLVPDPTFTWSVEGPGTLSSATGASVTLTATGDGSIRVKATAGSPPSNGTVVWTASGASIGVSNLTLGLGGGAVLGLVAGIGVGALVMKRRRGRGPGPPPGEGPPDHAT